MERLETLGNTSPVNAGMSGGFADFPIISVR
jgi:hypothetical protein